MIDAVRLPENIEQGAIGGPSFSTTIIKLTSGKERRNQNWSVQTCAYDIGYGIQEKSDYQLILDFYYARRGRARGFLFKDWLDYKVTGEACTPLTATTYQLCRTYPDDVNPYVRRITRPVAGTLKVYVGGTLNTDYTIGALGVLTFLAAPVGAVTADFEFDVPVRFDEDSLEVTLPYSTEDATIPSIKLVELPE